MGDLEQALTRVPSAGALTKQPTALSPEWRPKDAKLSEAVFREGLRLLAPSLSKPLTPDGAMAYWIVASGFGDADFRNGVQATLSERWISPAVLAECCDAARQERRRAEDALRQREEARQRAQERAEAEQARAARRVALEAEAASWASNPPADVEELRRRIVVRAELDSVRPTVAWQIREAKVAGTPLDMVFAVEHGRLVTLDAFELVEELAAEVAGHPVKVSVRDLGSAPSLMSDDEQASRRELLARQAAEICRDGEAQELPC